MKKHPPPTVQNYELLERKLYRRRVKDRVTEGVAWMKAQPIDWARGEWVWLDRNGDLCSIFEIMCSDMARRPSDTGEWAEVQDWMLKSAPSWSKDTFEGWLVELSTSFEPTLEDPACWDWVLKVLNAVPKARFKGSLHFRFRVGALLSDALLADRLDVVDFLLPHKKPDLNALSQNHSIAVPGQPDSVPALAFCRSEAAVERLLAIGMPLWSESKSNHQHVDPWPALALWLSQQASQNKAKALQRWSAPLRRAAMAPVFKRALKEDFWSEEAQEATALNRLGSLLLMSCERGDVDMLKTSRTLDLSKKYGAFIANDLALFNPRRLGEWLNWFTHEEKRQLERDVWGVWGYTLWDAVLASGGQGMHPVRNNHTEDTATFKHTLSQLTPQSLFSPSQVKYWFKQTFRVQKANAKRYACTRPLVEREPFGVFKGFNKWNLKSKTKDAKAVLRHANQEARPHRWSDAVFKREVELLEQGVADWWAYASRNGIERFIQSQHTFDAHDLYDVKTAVDAKALLERTVEPDVAARVRVSDKRLAFQKKVRAAQNVMSIAEDLKLEDSKVTTNQAVKSIMDLLLVPHPRQSLLLELEEMAKAKDVSSEEIRALLTDPKWLRVWDYKGLLTESNYLFRLFGNKFKNNALKEKGGKMSACVETALAEMVKLEEWVTLREKLGTALEESGNVQNQENQDTAL